MDGGFLELLDVKDRSPGDQTPIIIDSFAGGGGASTAIEMALGRSPDVAINHDPVALSMHAANHPETHHVTASVYSVDPREFVAKGQRVGLLWASPDCTHHSKAKGGKPLEKNIRDLAWVVVHYAEKIKPEIIMLENVEEFQDWGPLGDDLKPNKERKGETFREWVVRLKRLGYAVEWRVLRACDYGAPTIRKRLFVVARRDGKPIVWPKPTHAKRNDLRVIHGPMRPFRTAADIIDWSLPCPSIFDTSEEIMDKHGIRAVRPLADNTLRRIARGVQRYVIDASKPFIVVCNHAGDGFRGQSLDDPLATVTAARDATGLVNPILAPFTSYAQQGGRSRAADIPLHTITASRKDQNVIVTPMLINVANSKTTGRGPNAWDTREPLRTLTSSPGFAVVAPSLISVAHGYSGGRREYPITDPIGTMSAGGTQRALIAPSLAQIGYGEAPGQKPRIADIQSPLGTVVASAGKHALIAPHLMTMRNAGKPFIAGDEPTHTITAGGARMMAVSAFLAQHNGGPRNEGSTGRAADAPLSTVTVRGTQQALVAANMISMHGSSRRDGEVTDPVPTITAGGQHAGMVAAFLAKYYGTYQDPRLEEPLHTLTTKDRFGLVTVEIAGEEYAIVDIGMRMLTPREQFAAQGFGPEYQIDTGHDGRSMPKTAQTRMCGNSVSPPVAAALVKANCGHLKAGA